MSKNVEGGILRKIQYFTPVIQYFKSLNVGVL